MGPRNNPNFNFISLYWDASILANFINLNIKEGPRGVLYDAYELGVVCLDDLVDDLFYILYWNLDVIPVRWKL